jgi:hypothetical protein
MRRFVPIPDVSKCNKRPRLFDHLGDARKRDPPFPERDVMETWRGEGLLRLDVGHLDYLALLFGFFFNELPEVGGRANKRHTVQFD